MKKFIMLCIFTHTIMTVLLASPHYQLTNQGVIFDSTKQSYYPCAVDMRNVNFPYDWAVYASSDHGGGGIWLYVANGDPAVKSNWITYDSAKNAGGFDSYAVKPSGNPIFNDYVEGSGAETPCLMWLRDTCFMSYQVAYVAGSPYKSSLDQGTLLAYSLDGVNFIRYTLHTGGASATILSEPTNQTAVNHTGYFIWGNNPFDSIPYTYIGNSLLIGGAYPAGGLWGSNNGILWDFLTIAEPIFSYTNRVYGVDSVPIHNVSISSVHYNNARKLPNGDVVLMGYGITPGWASVARYSNLYEVTFDRSGLVIPKYCEKMMERSGERWDRNEHSTPTTLTYNGKLIVIYTATDSITNRLAMATCVLSDSNKIQSAPSFNPNINKATVARTNFVQNPALSTLPSWLTFVTSGSSVYSLKTYGIELLPKSATPGFRVSSAIIPMNYDFIEYYIDGVFKNGQNTTGIVIKPGTTYQAVSSQTAGVGAIAYSGASYVWEAYTRNNTTTVHSASTGQRLFRGVSGFGIRWWPRARKAQFLGAGMTSGYVWDVDSTIDLSQNFYPTFWRQSNDTMIIRAIHLKTKLRDTLAPIVTSVNSENKTLSIVFSESVDYDTNGVNGFKVMSPDSIPLTYLSGIGTDTLRYSMARKGKDSVTVSYNKNIAGIIDYGNNSLDSLSVNGVANNKSTGNNKSLTFLGLKTILQ